jgi:hypothetical protein
MRFHFVKQGIWKPALAVIALLALEVVPALGQGMHTNAFQPSCVTPAPQFCPAPGEMPAPGTPSMPGTPSTPPAGGGTDGTRPDGTGQTTDNVMTQPEGGTPPGERGAGGESTVALLSPGYIDAALILNQFRLRYDAAYDDNRPDRAEFLYAKCGCFRNIAAAFNDPRNTAAFVARGLIPDGKAAGPAIGASTLSETNVDFQDITGYLEVALNPNFSGFIEVPFRFLNPDVNANTAGFADMNAGFKYAFINNCDQVATFQFRTWIPTGASTHGLGTDHVSLEPALLYQQRLGEQWTLFGEFRGWIPIGGSDFAGNILRYGAGVGYTVFKGGNWSATPIAEVVGWTVLDGKELATDGLAVDPTTHQLTTINTRVLDASGDTIINGKIGVRINFGENSSIYAGYGRALTGDVWYKDIIRLEYRLVF